jgi:hypothetical protein
MTPTVCYACYIKKIHNGCTFLILQFSTLSLVFRTPSPPNSLKARHVKGIFCTEAYRYDPVGLRRFNLWCRNGLSEVSYGLEIRSPRTLYPPVSIRN